MTTDEEQLQHRGITIDILAQELQIKQKKLNKYLDKIYEQQDVLKNKNEHIEFYKRDASNLRKELHKVDRLLNLKRKKGNGKNHLLESNR